MSDINYTNPLGGFEVVNDVLGQIRRRLTLDCNLRATDGYSGGYSGEIKIKLNLHAVRTTPVELTIPIAQSPNVIAPAPRTFPAEDLEPVEVEEVIQIPVEENLNAVRDRIAKNKEENLKSEFEPVPEPEQQEEEPESQMKQKRKYTRRAALAGTTTE